MSKKKTFEEFVNEAKKVHGDKYEYVEYINASTKIPIICNIHGVFKQSPSKHLNGQGCPKCAEISRLKNRNHIRIKLSYFHRKLSNIIIFIIYIN